MRPLLTRRALIALISGLVTLAVVAGITFAVYQRQPQSSARVAATTPTATQVAYQVSASPTGHASQPTQVAQVATPTPATNYSETPTPSISSSHGHAPAGPQNTPTPIPTSDPPTPGMTATPTTPAPLPTSTTTPTPTATPTPTIAPTPTVAGVDDGMAISPTSPVQLSSVGNLSIVVTVKNTGTTTWTVGRYYAECVSNCGSASPYSGLVNVSPGATYNLGMDVSLPTPFSTSVTNMQWVFTDYGVPFGSPINIKVTQTVAVPILTETAPWCSDQSIWTATPLASGDSVTCTSAGTVLQTSSWPGPVLWLKNPPASFDSSQYRFQVHVHYSQYSSLLWAVLLADVTNSSACPAFHLGVEPVGGLMPYDTSAGHCADYGPTPSTSVVGQDATIGIRNEDGYGELFVNQYPQLSTSAAIGGSVGLEAGTSSGQQMSVTFSNFELDNNVSPYSTYVLG